MRKLVHWRLQIQIDFNFIYAHFIIQLSLYFFDFHFQHRFVRGAYYAVATPHVSLSSVSCFDSCITFARLPNPCEKSDWLRLDCEVTEADRFRITSIFNLFQQHSRLFSYKGLRYHKNSKKLENSKNQVNIRCFLFFQVHILLDGLSQCEYTCEEEKLFPLKYGRENCSRVAVCIPYLMWELSMDFCPAQKTKHPCEEVLTDDFSAWINFKTILNSLSLFLFLQLSMWIWIRVSLWLNMLVFSLVFVVVYVKTRKKRNMPRMMRIKFRIKFLVSCRDLEFQFRLCTDVVILFLFKFKLSVTYRLYSVHCLSVSKRAWACNQILFCFMFIYLVLFKI